MNKIRIIIYEQCSIVSEGLKQIINEQNNYEVCYIFNSKFKALEKINECKPNLAIINISFNCSTGIEFIQELKIQYPNLNILVFSDYCELIYAEKVINAGAQGFIMKSCSINELLKAINKVSKGEIYLSDMMLSRILKKSINGYQIKKKSVIDTLSNRELEVLQLISSGLTTKNISDMLNLSIKTIETYRSLIKKKLELKNSTQLIKFAIEFNLF